MGKKVNFIKGEMGNNEIICLYGEKISQINNLIKVGHKTLNPPYLGGDQAVFCYKENNKIKIKIVDRSLEELFEMCGGFTQVFGHAIFKLPKLRQHFNINQNPNKIKLITDAGTTLLKLDKKNKTVKTDMLPFAKKCKEIGIKEIKLDKVKGYKIGKYLVIDAKNIKENYKEFIPEKMDKKSKNILKEIQEKWIKQIAPNKSYKYNFSLYDENSTKGDIRAVFPHKISENNHIEPTCGTGSIGILLALKQEQKLKDGKATLKIESGGKKQLGGPEITKIDYRIKRNKLKKIMLSHNRVKVLANGKIYISK